MAELNNDIELIIARHLAGDTTSAEEKQLEEWIAHSPTNRQAFEASKRTFDLSAEHYHREKVVRTSDIDVNAEWKAFTNRINEAKVVPITSARTTWMRIAAAVLVFLAAGYAGMYFLRGDTTIRTAANTERVELPDGSIVTLNHYSVISYGKNFGDEDRNILLEGEAFFDVQPNTQLPFIIDVGDVEVKVVGTSFNVQGYKESGAVEVTVATGIVMMRETQAGEIKLTAGDKGTLDKEQRTLISAANENTNFLAWSTQRLEFNATSLRQVVDDLNKTYHAGIELAPGTPDSCVITVTFDRQSLDAVLDVLSNTLNLTVDRTGDRIVITAAGC